MATRRHPLLYGLTASAMLLFAAAVLWIVAIVSSWSGKCPSHLQLHGLDKGVSVWPPGAQCVGKGGHPYIYDALAWAEPLLIGLIGCVAVIMTVALVIAVRDRESNRAKAPSGPA